MPNIIIKNGLDNYLSKLKSHVGKYKINKISKNIGSIGKKIAQEEYAQTGVKPESITTNIINNSVEIVAKGEHLAFSEYGTGVRGEGTYDGILPTETLSFESPIGVQQTTKGWEYNYRKKQGKTQKDWTGFVAKAQMWKTSRRLQEEMPIKIKNELKGD